jgi:hypothetical protein
MLVKNIKILKEPLVTYMDMTFCMSSPKCANKECHRNFNEKHEKNAKRWWGDHEGGPLVAFTEFKDTSACEGFEPIDS